MIKSHKTHFIYSILLFAFILFVYKEWFFSYSILSNSDWLYFYNEAISKFDLFPTAWFSNQMGEPNIFGSIYPINLIYLFFNKINISYDISQRIVFMIIPLLVSIMGIYSLSKYINKNSTAALISVIVFLFNTYTLIVQSSHLTILASFSFSPFLFLSIDKFMKKKSSKYFVYNVLIGLIMSIYEFRIFYIFAILQILYICYFTYLLNISIHNKIRNLIISSSSIVLILLLNSYWLLPLLFSTSLTNNHIINRFLFGENFMSISRAITLFHPFWSIEKVTPFVIQRIPIYNWLVPIFAFLGLFYNKKNKYIIYFSFVALLGIFLTKQSANPFNSFYLFLYKHFPGFSVFREASKFYMLIVLSYSILIGAYVSKLKKYSSFIIISILFLFIINSIPIISGNYAALHKPRLIHNDYYEYKDLIINESDFTRTLWIPAKSRWGYYDNFHPQISLVDTFHNVWSDYYDSTTSDNANITSFINRNDFNDILNINTIKYVVVPIKDTINDDDFYINYDERDVYINKLDSLNYLEKIKFEDLIIYENLNYQGYITVFNEDLSEVDVNYNRVSASEYNLEFSKNFKDSIMVYFSEQFNEDWKLVIYNNGNKININPKKTGYNTNQYFVDIDIVDIQGKLYYMPQIYTNIGIVISSIIFIYLCLLIVSLNLYEKY